MSPCIRVRELEQRVQQLEMRLEDETCGYAGCECNVVRHASRAEHNLLRKYVFSANYHTVGRMYRVRKLMNRALFLVLDEELIRGAVYYNRFEVVQEFIKRGLMRPVVWGMHHKTGKIQDWSGHRKRRGMKHLLRRNGMLICPECGQ
jgi:hypothetical protein